MEKAGILKFSFSTFNMRPFISFETYYWAEIFFESKIYESYWLNTKKSTVCKKWEKLENQASSLVELSNYMLISAFAELLVFIG